MLFRREMRGIGGDVTVAFRGQRPTATGNKSTAMAWCGSGKLHPAMQQRSPSDDASASGFSSLQIAQDARTGGWQPGLSHRTARHRRTSGLALRQAAEPSDANGATSRRASPAGRKPRPAISRPSCGQRPAVLAAELASALDKEKLTFKTDVRNLLNSGLTESLDVATPLATRGTGAGAAEGKR